MTRAKTTAKAPAKVPAKPRTRRKAAPSLMSRVRDRLPDNAGDLSMLVAIGILIGCTLMVVLPHSWQPWRPEKFAGLADEVAAVTRQVSVSDLGRESRLISDSIETFCGEVESGRYATVDEIFAAHREQMQAVIPYASLDAWTRWGEQVGDRIGKFADAGKLQTTADAAAALREVARGLRLSA